MFVTDDHFVIGSMHVQEGKPCQDHALSGMDNGRAFAVVSDGCSGGGLTDVGARLMTLSVARAIRASTHLFADDIARQQGLALTEAKQLLSVSVNDLLATTLYTCLTPVGGFISVRGDGVAAIKWSDGSIALHRYEWPNNTPFYPAYTGYDAANFIDAHGGDEDARVFSEDVWTYAPGRGFTHVETRLHSIADGMRGIILVVAHLEPLDAVAVFSDGVCQVDGVDWKEAVRDLLAFKSTEGVFAKRRMIRFVQDTKKIGRGPFDDIAYAVIRHLPEPEDA